MAFCINCGQQLLDGAKFCSNCGTAMGSVKTENAQRKTVYDGEVHKCPNCGEVLNSFSTNCSACGYELRSVKTNSPVEALAKKVEGASSLEEKLELITNFYIPNTKEDIYDFFILAVSNLEDKSYDTDDAWYAKLEQAYHKAKLSFGKTPEFDYIEELYDRTHSKISKRWFTNFIRKNKMACISALLLGIGLFLFAIGITMMDGNNMAGMWALLGMGFMISSALGPSLAYADKAEKRKQEGNDSKQS